MVVVEGLALALDYLVVLTDVARRSRMETGASFCDFFENALDSTFQEHGMTFQSMGLSFTWSFRISFWTGGHES